MNFRAILQRKEIMLGAITMRRVVHYAKHNFVELELQLGEAAGG